MASQGQTPRYFGRYEVLEELGSGAMGVVYLCVDARLARPVAVKVVKDVQALSPSEREQYLARFRREAQAAGRLDHPDIVQVYDVGPSYLVMEFVDGRPLADVIRSGPPLAVGEITTIVLRVADALDYAHRQGVVHRDVKPGNILRLEDGAVKVMDFGVARLPSSTLTASGTVVGSVRYMAPEQMLGHEVDGRADVFSLGAVAYELLTGRAPFPGQTATEVVTRVVHGDYVPACDVEPRLPAACDRVFAGVFASDPARRYALALDFARALEGAVRSIAPVCLRDPLQPGSLAPRPALASDRDQVAPTRLLEADMYGATRELPGAPSEAVLAIDSRPQGADVRLDARFVGCTPLSALPVPLGRHRLRFELAGHVPAELEVEAGDEQRLHAVSIGLTRVGAPAGADTVERFGPGMIPPVRVSGAPPETPAEDGAGVAATAVVEAVVGESGQVRDVRVVISAGATLDRALADALAGWRFTPARRDGAPVAVRIRVTHRFAP